MQERSAHHAARTEGAKSGLEHSTWHNATGGTWLRPDGGTWQQRAQDAYDEATFGGNPAAIDDGERELDAVEADLALARGRLLHARFLAEGPRRERDERERALFTTAVDNRERLGNRAGLAEALFWLGCCLQVVYGDEQAAAGHLRRSYDIAVETGADLVRSFAVRHLAFAALDAGRLDEAKAQFAESLRLRREVATSPVIAAAIIPLGVVAGRQDGPPAAERFFAEARIVAETSGAAGVLHWIEQARAEL